MKKEDKRVYLDKVVEAKDEYKWSELNCFYRAFANVFNSVDEEYYDVFLMLIMSYVIYGVNGDRVLTFDKDDFVLQYYKKELTKVFNTELKENIFGSKKKMLLKLQEDLSMGNVVVMPCDLYYLPYSKTYLELHKRHYLIIKGIDVAKNILFVLDNMHNRLGADVKYSDFMIDADVVYNMNDSFVSVFDIGKRDRYYWIINSNEKKDFHKRFCKYISDLSEFILNKDIKDDYEYKIFNGISVKEINILHYMEFVNSKKLLFDTIRRCLDMFMETWKVSKLKEEIEKYLEKKEECKIYYGARLQKVIDENELAKLQDILHDEKRIWQEFNRVIELVPMKTVIRKSEFFGYKLVNNKKVTVSCQENIFHILLDDNGVYDIWKNVNDGVILYKENAQEKLDYTVNMSVFCESGASNHVGIYLELVDGTKILFGSMGRLNMAIYKLDNTTNYDCLTKNIPFDKEVELRVKEDEGMLAYYVNGECIFKDARHVVCKYGVFAKTWQVNRCEILMRIREGKNE